MQVGPPPPGLTVAGNLDPLGGEAEGLRIVRRSSAGKRLAAALGLLAVLGAIVAAFVLEGTIGFIGCFVIVPTVIAFGVGVAAAVVGAALRARRHHPA